MFESHYQLQLRNSHHRSVSAFGENCTLVGISSLPTATRCAGLAVGLDGERKERHAAACLSFWVPADSVRLHPSEISMLGRSEFALRNSPPPIAAPNLRRTCDAAQKGRRKTRRRRVFLFLITVQGRFPFPHSNSTVPGGFAVMSYSTRLTPFTSLTMRTLTRSSSS